MTTAGIITIGDELLLGQTLDTNSHFIAKELSNAQIKVTNRTVIGDNAEELLKTIDAFFNQVDLIICTGGLGPTDDDITKSVIATYFEDNLEINGVVLTQVEHVLGKPREELLASNVAQASIPSLAIPLKNELGIAPGIVMRKDNKLLIALPGVPFEMEHLMKERVMPFLNKTLVAQTPFNHQYIQIFDIPESEIAAKIQQLVDDAGPNYHLAFLPQPKIVLLRLTEFYHKFPSEKAIHLLNSISQMFKGNIISESEQSLSYILGEHLKKQEFSIATAESCTGGFVGHTITNTPGSAAYYMGSVVSYANEIKEHILGVNKATLQKYGAVSEETVIEMVNGVQSKFNTDVAIAFSGILGPKSDDTKKPVGLLWIAIKIKSHLYTRKVMMNKDRITNKTIALNYGLGTLIQLLINNL